MTKLGSGMLTLSAANTFTGGTKLVAGTLSLANACRAGFGSDHIFGRDAAVHLVEYHRLFSPDVSQRIVLFDRHEWSIGGIRKPFGWNGWG